MARPELPGAAVPHSIACSSISESDSHPLFQPPAKNALLFFVWLWYIGLGIVKAALKSSIFLFFLGQLCYFNLSPQGDGNNNVSCLSVKDRRISTYPRKGTITLASSRLVNVCPIATYPRKGAKTNPPMPPDIRKLYHPRKGAKNSASKMVRSFSFACLNFSVSVGFFSMNRAAAAFSLP